jgi:hypothetical protein
MPGSMEALKALDRHYVMKARYDERRDNYHVQPTKNRLKAFQEKWPDTFALVVWFVSEEREHYFAVPYTSVQHLFRGAPNRGNCWDVHVVRGRFYAGSELLGTVNVSSCRSNREDARLLVAASLERDEACVKEALARLAAATGAGS